MTILKAKGRMTKNLETPYSIGDRVVALVKQHQRDGRMRAGEIGTIREISISDPRDGDATFPIFYVKVARGTVLLGATEFAPRARR